MLGTVLGAGNIIWLLHLQDLNSGKRVDVAQMVKVSACNVGDQGSIPGWGRSPGGGNGNPL